LIAKRVVKYNLRVVKGFEIIKLTFTMGLKWQIDWGNIKKLLRARRDLAKYLGIYIGWIPGNFWGKITKMTTRANSWIQRIHPINFRLYMIFWNFSWKKPFSEKWRKSYIEWVGKNPKIRPSYHFLIFIQKWQFRLENENFEICRNSA